MALQIWWKWSWVLRAHGTQTVGNPNWASHMWAGVIQASSDLPTSSRVHGKQALLLSQGTALPGQYLCCSHLGGTSRVAPVYIILINWGWKRLFPCKTGLGLEFLHEDAVLRMTLWSLEPKIKPLGSIASKFLAFPTSGYFKWWSK